MTCIVGLTHPGGVLIAGDSLASSGSYCVGRTDPKVFERAGFIFGFTSSYRMGQILMHCWNPPVRHPNVDVFKFMVTDFIESVRAAFSDMGFATNKDGAEFGGTFLVGFEGRLFEIDCDYQVGENAVGYAACGCGSEIALGAVHAAKKAGVSAPNALANMALEAAQEFSSGVRGPFVVVSLEHAH